MVKQKGAKAPWLILLALFSACAGHPPPPPPQAPAPPPGPPKPPPEPLPSPIEADIPALNPTPLPRRSMCRAGACTLSRLVPEDLQKNVPDKGSLMLWEEMIGKNARVTIPPDREVTVAGVVLEGSVGLLSLENQWGAPAKMTQWQGFHAPGSGVTLVAMDKKPARIAMVIAASGTDGSLAKHLARWGKSRKGLEWKTREKPLEQIDFTQIQPLSWKQGYHARIGWEVGGEPEGAAKEGTAPAAGDSAAPAQTTQEMAMTLLRFSKDAGWTAHVHEKSQECLAVIEGDGELSLTFGLVDDGAAPSEKTLALEPGVVVCIPQGMGHAWKPSGKTPFLALQVFSPPGPEQGFKRLAAGEAEPDKADSADKK